MIFIVILTIITLQGIGYKLIEKYRIKYVKLVLFVFILLILFIVLPSFFYPQPKEDEYICGLPYLAINMICLFGGIISIITHLVYYFRYKNMI